MILWKMGRESCSECCCVFVWYGCVYFALGSHSGLGVGVWEAGDFVLVKNWGWLLYSVGPGKNQIHREL